MRLSYQGPASCSVLVDENGDSSAAPRSASNHTKTAANTGRWSHPAPRGTAAVPVARGKRSLDRRRYPSPGMPDGDGGTAVHADGGGTTLNGNTNRALPAQMYDALLAVADRPAERHWKRRANDAMDMVVYRRPSDGTGEEPVDFVPLLPASRDSDRGGGGRIRVNVSIGGSADGAVYAVSLSLPETVRVPARPPPPPPPHPSAMSVGGGGGGGGTECECYCPCLEPDDDDDGDRNGTAVADDGDRNGTAVADAADSTTTAFPDTTTGAADDDYAEGWTTSVAVGPETCPPPVLMFCETGEWRASGSAAQRVCG